MLKICELGPSWRRPERVSEKCNLDKSAGLVCFWLLWVLQGKVDLEFEEQGLGGEGTYEFCSTLASCIC